MDTLSAPQYVYAQLSPSQIRLVSIVLEDDQHPEAPLSCYIDIADQEAIPEYSALSYTWGSGGLSETLSIASRTSGEDKSVLSITANCKAALLALRKNGTSIVWIDAICINQNDDAERSVQVAKMRDIYSQAAKVNVFLGKIIVEDMQWFYEFNELPLRAMKLSQESDPDATAIMIKIGTKEWNEQAFAGSNRFVESMIANPYFSRVWILQELACAKHADALFSNAESRSWPLLMQYLKSSDASRKVYGSSITAELPRVMSLQGDQDPTKLGLLGLLLETRQADATDKKDKVYALLGIASDATSVSVPINYADHEVKVFTTTAQRLIDSSRSLAVLTAVCEGSSLPNLPSWVPDFGLIPPRSCLSQNYREGKDAGFTASSDQPFSGSYEQVGLQTVLNCKAKLVGNVVIISPPHQSPPDPKHWGLWTFTAQANHLQILASQSGARQVLAFQTFGRYWGDSMIDTVARTVVAYRADPAKPVMAKPLSQGQAADITNRMFHPECQYILFSQGQTLPERDWYQEHLEHHCRGRRLAVMTSSHLALVSDQTITGDSLYVLQGFSMPVILRRDSAGSFKLIGEAYCHGIMDGQLNDDPKIASLVGDWQEIRII